METKNGSETGRAGQAADKLHDALYPEGEAKGERPDLPLGVPNETVFAIRYARQAQEAFEREARRPDGDLALKQALLILPDSDIERVYFGGRRMPEDFAQVLREARELLTEEQQARAT